MKYVDGTEACVGDRVRCQNGDSGVVVFSIDTQSYSAEFPQAEWEYLKSGIMIRTDQGALVHFEDGDGQSLLLGKV